MAKKSMKVNHKNIKLENIIDVNYVVDHIAILENMVYVEYVLEN